MPLLCQPIHAPGAIQAFGVLIAFDLRDDDTMIVQQVSEVRLLAPVGPRQDRLFSKS